MKWLVGLLVVLNLGLLAYFNVDLIAPAAVVTNSTISPEKLKILTEKDLAAMPKKVVAAAPITPVAAEPAAPPIIATSCYAWGNFTASNLPSAQVALLKLGLESVVKKEANSPADRRFWVYYPPLKTAELARAKAEEIKAFGVGELFIVQDSQWRNAISFGLFQDEQLATNLLNDLQAKGVKGATKALRSPGKSISSLFVKDVKPATALELQRITPEFVGSELKVAACNSV